jgi:hypothetical protein
MFSDAAARRDAPHARHRTQHDRHDRAFDTVEPAMAISSTWAVIGAKTLALSRNAANQASHSIAQR